MSNFRCYFSFNEFLYINTLFILYSALLATSCINFGIRCLDRKSFKISQMTSQSRLQWNQNHCKRVYFFDTTVVHFPVNLLQLIANAENGNPIKSLPLFIHGNYSKLSSTHAQQKWFGVSLKSRWNPVELLSGREKKWTQYPAVIYSTLLLYTYSTVYVLRSVHNSIEHWKMKIDTMKMQCESLAVGYPELSQHHARKKRKSIESVLFAFHFNKLSWM